MSVPVPKGLNSPESIDDAFPDGSTTAMEGIADMGGARVTSARASGDVRETALLPGVVKRSATTSEELVAVVVVV